MLDIVIHYSYVWNLSQSSIIVLILQLAVSTVLPTYFTYTYVSMT
jgi:hypothetical protein